MNIKEYDKKISRNDESDWTIFPKISIIYYRFAQPADSRRENWRDVKNMTKAYTGRLP